MEQTIDHNGNITPYGQRILDHMERQFAEADAKGNADAINRMAGLYKFYYVNVHKLNAMSQTDWLREMTGAVEVAAQDMAWLESQQQQAEKVEEAVSANAELSDKLEALSAQLTEALAKIEALENKKRGKSQPKTETEIADDTEESAEQEA